jgi:hypothetical protein
MDTRVEDFCKILAKFNVHYSKSQSGDCVSLEVEFAQFDFYGGGLIFGMIDFPQVNYFHVWEIMPNSIDYEQAIKKVLATLTDAPEPVSDRLLNASTIY